MYSFDPGVDPVNIRIRLVILVVLALVPHLVLLGLQAVDQFHTYQERERRANQDYAAAVATAFERYLQSIWEAELAMGAAIVLREGQFGSDEIGRFLAQQLTANDVVVRLTWLNPEGVAISCTDERTCGHDLSDQPHIAAILQGSEISLSLLTESPATKEPVVMVSRGIKLNGDLHGIVVATLDVTKMYQVLPAPRNVGRSHGLVDGQGTLVYHSTEPYLPVELQSVGELGVSTAALQSQAEALLAAFEGQKGSKLMGAAELIPSIGWLAFASTPVEVVTAEAYRHAARYAAVALVADLVAVAAILWFARRILRPVADLEQAALAISRGDLSARVQPHGNDEIAVAARAFNQMADRMQQSEAKLRAQAAQQAAAARLGFAALEGTSLDALLDQAVSVLRETLDVEFCSVMELLPGEEQLVLRAGCGWHSGALGKLKVPASGTSQAGYALLSRQPVIVTDLSRETRFQAPLLLKAGIVSGMSVIIQGEYRPYGVLGVHAAKPRIFTEDDLHFLQSVANVVGAAVERAVAQRRHVVQYEVARALAQSGSITVALSRVLQAVCEGLDWEMGAFWVPDHEAGVLRCQALWRSRLLKAPHFEAATLRTPLPLNQGVPAMVFASGGEPQWLDPRREPSLMRTGEAEKDGIQTAVGFPVMADEVVGVIELASARARRHDPAVTDLMRVVGGLVAQFVERKRAEEELRRVNAELEERVADRTHRLEVAIQELEAFSYSVSHDLQGPLRSIEGFAAALEEDAFSRLRPEEREYLRRIGAAVRQMNRLIRDLLRLSQLARKDLRRRRVDLTAVARAVAAELQRLHPDQTRTTIRIQDGMWTYADAGLVYVAVFNLMDNAWKFTSQRPRPLIEVGQTQVDGETTFYVRDNGVGFNMEQADRLFQPFKRLHPSGAYQGSGIGLATVQRIVRRHGGQVWAESREGEGAVFFFTLGPKARED